MKASSAILLFLVGVAVRDVQSYAPSSSSSSTTTTKLRYSTLPLQSPISQYNRLLSSSTSSRYKTQRRMTSSKSKLSLFYDNNNNDNNDDKKKDTVVAIDYTNMKPQVFQQRWVQLAYLSLLALLSDWVCFSVAAAPSTFEESFPGHSASSIIDIFLFTNVASSFLVTDLVAKYGLQRMIQGAAALMTLGCWFRSGFGFVPTFFNDFWGTHTGTGVGGLLASIFGGGASPLVDYNFVVIGTVMVGIAQPFFQCTPPLLSAMWFANNERATSTAIALNFNQIGIATAFLVGGAMATTTTGLENYLGLIAVMTSLVTAGCIVQFQNEPPIPPSTSELEKKIKGEEEPPFLESVQKFFKTRGFTNALAAFICSIAITNVVGAFIDELMTRGGLTGQFQIDLAGAGFELAIVAGGIILGGLVDRTKEYKKVTLACLAATALLCIPLGLTDHALGKEPLFLIFALLGLGMAAGPIQPINAELAVDVTYPGDETAVESVQQIGGNLVSALLIPIAEFASEKDFTLLRNVPGLESDVRGDVILLVAIAMITFAYFSGFDAPLKRSMADGNESEDETVVLDVEATEAVVMDGIPSDMKEAEAVKA